ncbi:putative L-ascorbate peroxidase 6 [Impatiens glandulifera]|uniref:putative L-ascorbate peroxidase 6 n=1 Tax=Impatiens glandulifera TaxID=253017 RepID=UPI001FB0AE00|nr:putative L-ascorbate peroxidase 6 [Impatiens glandulifera]
MNTGGIYNASLLLSSTELKLYLFPFISNSRSKLKFSRKPAPAISCASSIPPPEENDHKRRRLVMSMGIIPVFLHLNDSFMGTVANADEDSFLVEEIKKILTKGKAAGILRLVFHDAGTFEIDSNTGGMNGSIIYELDRPENKGLKKSVKILEKAKEQVDMMKPVSWADMIAVAGAEAVSLCGGPKIPVRLGRIDALVPDQEDKLPSESLNAIELKQSFQKKGFNTQELVVLSGAHTLGSKGFGNPNTFDNSYFKILQQKLWSTSSGGMGSMIGLPSDRSLVDDKECLRWISKYADNEELFFEDFKKAYIKLVDSGAKWKTFL